MIDRIQPGIPAPQRCPFAHHLLGDPSYGEIVHSLYHKTGKSIESFMYHDMVRGLREAVEAGIEVHFLTGNLHPLADGVTAALGITPSSVRGVWHNDRRSSFKPFELYSMLLENPNSIIVMIDDSDGSLIQGLGQDSILDCNEVRVRIQDSVLFIARGPDSVSGRSHVLADRLTSMGIPHGRNYYAESERIPTGYQGFNQLVSTYLALQNS